jgi:NADPH-dependent glutamate synthase beta subunit-like oxidoreductase/NAD-dependent dihydropyrimidine dehydrogenase PreA subunit
MAKDVSTEKQAQVEEVVCEGGKVYLAPCQVACPLGEDIQRSHAMIALLPLDLKEAADQIVKIGDEIYAKNPFFLICSYICGLCEKQCNYKDQTGAVRRRRLVGFIAKHYLSHLEARPPFPAPTKEKVAVIGGGPGGLMCAYMLGERGYQVTVFERNFELGGALRYIPQYRLPENIIHFTIRNLLRIAHIEVELGVKVGEGDKTLEDLKNDGYKAVFIAIGTPAPRPLTFERELVGGAELEEVMFGLNLLFDVNQGIIPPKFYQGKRVIVVGGGNVAFDVARTARRLGGDVTVVCLENADKTSKDGIPADVEEIEGATEEGIKIIYSRGVEQIISKEGKFNRIKCPRCTSVFEEDGRFNPQFDRSDAIYLEGDILLVTIGQGPERTLFQKEGLLNEQGRLDIDHLTLMSNLREGVFIGGDVKRVGFAMEAMRDGVTASESIDRYIKGEDMKAGREEREYETASIPERLEYKPQPALKWVPAEERLHFEPFEKEYTMAEVIEEARRCLCCGPCKSCKGCVVLGLQSEIPATEVNEDLCSGCGVCVAVCPYEASKLKTSEGRLKSVVDDSKCKRCGVCVTVCPSGARTIKDALAETIAGTYATLSK